MRDDWQPPSDLPKFGDPTPEDPRDKRISDLESALFAVWRMTCFMSDPHGADIAQVVAETLGPDALKRLESDENQGTD